MSIHKKAPLIEAALEIRWGVPTPIENGLQFMFGPEDSVFFMGQFFAAATKVGYIHFEPTNAPQIPHLVTHRFRKEPQSSEIIQVGLGVMTVHRGADTYDWAPFLAQIDEALGMLNEARQGKMGDLPPYSLELRYQDAFLYRPGETALKVLRDKLHVDFKLPPGVTDGAALDASSLDVRAMSFNMALKQPDAKFNVDYFDGKINNKPGVVLNLAVRSEVSMGHKLAFDKDFVSEWAVSAHEAQKHVFRTLVEPTLGS
ncbi:TIGR04255 family protein [Cupriavidus pinatubonensis]|uniref:TIGR04255 family protein n=1 Tax=Cupriavidus pinatubonensis TaxID=248026 RepID=UPI0015E37010|nr:TIGR04255 family protein [Cupriavidus pinatubonensis]